MTRSPSYLGGWLIRLAGLAILPLLAWAQPGVTQGDGGIPLTPRTWSGAPGMTLIGRGLPGGEVDAGAGRSCLAAMADGGYTLAGNVQGPSGRELWIARHDRLGLPVWSRIYSAPFDIELQAITALPDGGAMVAGSLGQNRPGFLIALDVAGEPLWSRLSSDPGQAPGATERLVGVAMVEPGWVLAVGQVLHADGKAAALILSVPLDGSVGWRLELAEAKVARVLIPAGDGWLIAGESADPAHAVWLARVNTSGQVIWRRHFGEVGSGAATAIVPLPKGDILLAGQDAVAGEVWLRRLDGQGEPQDGEGQRLKPTIGGVPIVRSLQGLAVTTDGGLWLGGETEAGDAWLARLDGEGRPLWVRAYGGEGWDAFSALLARDGGVMAAGVSESGAAEGVRRLWLARLDGQGDPLAPPPLSGQAAHIVAAIQAGLRDDSGLILGGDIAFTETLDGSVRLWLPFSRLRDRMGGPEDLEVDLGTLAIQARPVDPSTGTWRFMVDWPASFLFRDGTGTETAWLGMAQSYFALDLDPGSGLMTAVDLRLQGLDFQRLANPRLGALHQGLGLEEPALALAEEVPVAERLSLGRLTLSGEWIPDAAGRWGGGLRLRLDDLRLGDTANRELGHLGGLRLDVGYADMDLDALESVSARLAGLEDLEPAALLAELPTLVESYLMAAGRTQGEFALSDLALDLKEAGGGLRLGEFSLAAFAAPGGGQPPTQDFRVQYGIKGLDLIAEGNRASIGEASLLIAGEGLHIPTLIKSSLSHLTETDTPITASQDPLPPLLRGIEVGLTSHRFGFAMPGEEPIAFDNAKLRLALSGLDTQAPVLAFAYGHEGLAGMDKLSADLVPQAGHVDLALSGLPLAELLSLAMTEGGDPLAAIRLMTSHAARLDINAIEFQLPAGGVRVQGMALMDAQGGVQDMPVARINANIELRNLDALARVMGASMNPAEREELAALVAFLKIVGAEAKEGDGEPRHHFNLEANSLGEVSVNGKDLTPLLREATD